MNHQKIILIGAILVASLMLIWLVPRDKIRRAVVQVNVGWLCNII